MKKHRQKKALIVANARWLAYATAGAATALGSAASSEGEIHYSGIVNYAFNGSRSWSYATFPLNGSAHLFFLHSTNGPGEGVARFFIPGSHSRLGSSVGRFAGRMAQNSDVYPSRLANRVELSQLTFRNSCYSTYFGDVRCHGATIGRSDAAHGNFKQGGAGLSVLSLILAAVRNWAGLELRRPARLTTSLFWLIMPGPITVKASRRVKNRARKI